MVLFSFSIRARGKAVQAWCEVVDLEMLGAWEDDAGGGGGVVRVWIGLGRGGRGGGWI